MGAFFSSDELVFVIRIVLACICGAIIGFERQQRVKVAGLRTHILISMAAALMMIISKYGFIDVAGSATGLNCDVSRVAAGIITGVGVLSGGIVFIGKRGNVSGITTAAGIWATIGIGMAMGAGMYLVGGVGVVLVELFQFILHHNLPVYRHAVTASAVFKLDDEKKDYHYLLDQLSLKGITSDQYKWEKKGKNESILKCELLLNTCRDKEEALGILQELPLIQSFDIFY